MTDTEMSLVHAAYCPHCRAVANLNISISLSIVTEPDRKENIVLSRTYHCAVCGLFVRGEEHQMMTLEYRDPKQEFHALLRTTESESKETLDYVSQ